MTRSLCQRPFNVLLLLAAIAAVAGGAPPPAAGIACPIPKPAGGSAYQLSQRAALGVNSRPPGCCGVRINGLPLGLPGVVCWPLLEGDEVESEGWAIAIVLVDGSRLHLGEASRLKLGPEVQLLSGTLIWDLRTAPKRRVAWSTAPKTVPNRGSLHIFDGNDTGFKPDTPLPRYAPDVTWLLQRFTYSAGRILASD